VSAAEPVPLMIRGPGPGPIEAAAGATVKVPLKLVRRGVVSGNVAQLRIFGQGFDKAAAVDVPVSADSHEFPLDLAKLKIEPGRHTIMLYGAVTTAYRPPPEAEKPVSATDIVDIIVSEPILLDVKPAAAVGPTGTAPEGEKKS
jgi:hypothetical protein